MAERGEDGIARVDIGQIFVRVAEEHVERELCQSTLRLGSEDCVRLVYTSAFSFSPVNTPLAGTDIHLSTARHS